MEKNQFRTEEDSFGSVEIAADKLWGIQTERSLKYFSIGNDLMPFEMIQALALIKKAAAIVNGAFGFLPPHKVQGIVEAAEEICQGKWQDQFPLRVWQTGSGTQTHMNVNEVIAHRANQLSGSDKIHPNDDVNMSQSTNDVFPAAMHLVAVRLTDEKLIPVLTHLWKAFQTLSKDWENIVKMGRTHLQDAVPITLGQEFSGYAYQIEIQLEKIKTALTELYELPLGGTAVGTGMNTHPDFAQKVCQAVAQYTQRPFCFAKNRFALMASHDGLVRMGGVLRSLAGSLIKIVNDIRWMSSGPDCGVGELILPSNEPGSSMMPGKVNPTQCEALLMVCVQVMGHDFAMNWAGAHGDFELNVYKPLLIYNFVSAVHLLSDAMVSFQENLLKGIQPNLTKIQYYIRHSKMIATALTPLIGYEKASQVVKIAQKQNKTVKEICMEMGIVDEMKLDKILDLKAMTQPNRLK